MRILLVKPKARLASIRGLEAFARLEPLELGYLAAVVPPGHEVRVTDLRLRRAPRLAFRRELARRPDLVAFTGYTHEAGQVKELAGLVRRTCPGARVVVGGHHATVEPADFDVPEVDALVRGAGCAPFRAIVEAYAAGHEPLGIPNVLLPGARFDAAAAGEWPRFPDPATLPAPRRDLWDARAYRAVWVAEEARPWETIYPPVAMVRTSFGCRMTCSFCVVPFLCGGRHMPRPADLVADEIAALGPDHVYFADDENFIDPEFAHALAGAIERRGIRKRYFAWTRSTTVNRFPDLFRRWRALGLDGAFLGFEFVGDRQLREARKGATVEDNERAHRTLRELGVAVHAAFMVTPEFTREDFEDLRRYVRGMPPAQCSFTVCSPSPGTAAYAAIRDRIWVADPHAIHDCMHPLTPTALPLREFARLFARQAREGVAKSPLRQVRRPIPPRDALRVTLAGLRYHRGFRNLYRDFPRRAWD